MFCMFLPICESERGLLGLSFERELDGSWLDST